MMVSHQSTSLQRLDGMARRMHLDGAWRLEMARAGWLEVTAGRVWLTRDGDGDDHVLGAGGRLWLGRGERVVIEPWRLGEQASLCWHGATAPAAQRDEAQRPGSGWAVVARALGALGRALPAGARRTAARA